MIVQMIGDCSGAEQVCTAGGTGTEVVQDRCRAHAEVQMKPQMCRCRGAEVQLCAVVQWCRGGDMLEVQR